MQIWNADCTAQVMTTPVILTKKLCLGPNWFTLVFMVQLTNSWLTCSRVSPRAAVWWPGPSLHATSAALQLYQLSKAGRCRSSESTIIDALLWLDKKNKILTLQNIKNKFIQLFCDRNWRVHLPSLQYLVQDGATVLQSILQWTASAPQMLISRQ